MAELIDKNLLLEDMKKELEKAVKDDDMTEDEGRTLLTSALALKGFVGRQPTTTEAEIRNKAIDEFTKALKNDHCGLITNWDKPYGISFERINEIAEQLKENKHDGERCN